MSTTPSCRKRTTPNGVFHLAHAHNAERGFSSRACAQRFEPMRFKSLSGSLLIILYCYEFSPAGVRSTASFQSSRVAHRTDNSVVTFRNNAGTLSRVGLQPHHGLANFLPAQNRVNRRISIYLSTCAGSLPGDRTSTQVGLDTNRSSGPFRSAVITERVLSPDLAGSDSI